MPLVALVEKLISPKPLYKALYKTVHFLHSIERKMYAVFMASAAGKIKKTCKNVAIVLYLYYENSSNSNKN